ncbi:MAG: hypothetical protein V1750_10330 [Acidobacteriota bacterium]
MSTCYRLAAFPARNRAQALARVLGRRPEAMSRWAARAGEPEGRDDTFRRAYDELDAALAGVAMTQVCHVWWAP